MDDFIKAEGVSSVTDLYTIDSSVEDGKVYGLPGRCQGVCNLDKQG